MSVYFFFIYLSLYTSIYVLTNTVYVPRRDPDSAAFSHISFSLHWCFVTLESLLEGIGRLFAFCRGPGVAGVAGAMGRQRELGAERMCILFAVLKEASSLLKPKDDAGTI